MILGWISSYCDMGFPVRATCAKKANDACFCKHAIELNMNFIVAWAQDFFSCLIHKRKVVRML